MWFLLERWRLIIYTSQSNKIDACIGISIQNTRRFMGKFFLKSLNNNYVLILKWKYEIQINNSLENPIFILLDNFDSNFDNVALWMYIYW